MLVLSGRGYAGANQSGAPSNGIEQLRDLIQSCRRLKNEDKKKQKFKECEVRLRHYLTALNNRALDKLMVHDLGDVIKLYIKIAIELNEMDGLNALVNKLNEFSNGSQFYHLGTSFFLNRFQLLDLIDSLKETDVYSAKKYLVLYLFSFQDHQSIETEKEKSQVLKHIDDIAVKFESISYFERGFLDEHIGSEVEKQLFYDVLLLTVYNDLKTEGNTSPFDLIQSLKQRFKMDVAQTYDVKGPDVKTVCDIRVMNEGLHNSTDMRKELSHSYQFSDTETTMSQDVFERSEESKRQRQRVEDQTLTNQARQSNQQSEDAVNEVSTQQSNDHSNSVSLMHRDRHSEGRLNNQGGASETANTHSTAVGARSSDSVQNDKRLETQFATTKSQSSGVNKSTLKDVSTSVKKKSELAIPLNLGSCVGIGSELNASSSNQTTNGTFSNTSSGTSNGKNEMEGSTSAQSTQSHNQTGNEDRLSQSITHGKQDSSNDEYSNENGQFKNEASRLNNTKGTTSRHGQNYGQESVSTAVSNDKTTEVIEFDCKHLAKSSEGKDVKVRKEKKNEVRITVQRIKGHQYFRAVELQNTVTTQQTIKNIVYKVSGVRTDSDFDPNHSLIKRLSNEKNRCLQDITYTTKTRTSFMNCNSEYEVKYFKFQEFLDFVGAFDRLKGALGLDENELDWYETVLDNCLKTCSGNIKLKPYKANVRRLMMFYDELNIKNRSIPDHWRNKVEDLIAKGNELKLMIDELGDGAFHDDASALSIVNTPCQKGFYIGLDQCMSLKSTFQHVLLKGITGSGKSWKFIIPNILKLVDQNAVVTDLDGTIYDKTHAQMRAKGYNVKRLNLMSRDNSDMYNPFEYLTNDSETLIEDVISAIVINCNNGGKGDGNLQYWQSKVKQFLRIITQVMMYESTFSTDTSKTFNCLEEIVKEFKEENGQGAFNKNLGCFLHLYKRLTFDRLCELSQECVEKLESHKDDNVKRLKDSIDELINVNPKIESKGPEEAFGTMKGVAGSAVGALRSKDLLAVMSGKDSMFDTLKQTDEKTIVYVCVKTSDIKNYSLILTLFFQDLFRVIREVNDPLKVDETKTRPMLCFMDEFGNYKINNFAAEATTLRKFKVGLMCAVQSRDQIEKNYGRTLLDDGFVTQLYLSFGKGDQYAKELSESSGLKEDLNGKVKPKLSAYDLMHMPDMRACLVHEGKETVIYDIKTPDPIPKVQAVDIEVPIADEQTNEVDEEGELNYQSSDVATDMVKDEQSVDEEVELSNNAEDGPFSATDLRTMSSMYDKLFDSNTPYEDVKVALEIFYLTGNPEVVKQLNVERKDTFDEDLKTVTAELEKLYTVDLNKMIQDNKLKGTIKGEKDSKIPIIKDAKLFCESCIDAGIYPITITSLDVWNNYFRTRIDLLKHVSIHLMNQELPSVIVEKIMNEFFNTEDRFCDVFRMSILKIAYSYQHLGATRGSQSFKHINVDTMIDVMRPFLRTFFNEHGIQSGNADHLTLKDVQNVELNDNQLVALKEALFKHQSLFSFSMLISLDLKGEYRQWMLLAHFIELINYLEDRTSGFSNGEEYVEIPQSYDELCADPYWNGLLAEFKRDVANKLELKGAETDQYNQNINDYFLKHYLNNLLKDSQDMTALIQPTQSISSLFEKDLTSSLFCNQVERGEDKQISLIIHQKVGADMEKNWTVRWCGKDMQVINSTALDKRWKVSIENHVNNVRAAIIKQFKQASINRLFGLIILMVFLSYATGAVKYERSHFDSINNG